MKFKKWFTLAVMAVCLFMGGTAGAEGHILNATAVARVAGDGEHVSEVVLQYDAPLAASSVSAGDY